MASSIIEAITEFIGSCPLLEDGVLRVDAMGENAIEYTVETGIFDPLLKRYVNGDEYRQYQFNFGSREYYSMDRIQNIQNSSFYEKFAELRSKTVLRMFRNFQSIVMQRKLKCFPMDTCLMDP